MKATLLLTLLAAHLAVPSGAAAATDKDKTRPNIILILADDLGYGDLGCYGGAVPTPRIDELAKQGMRFTDFHSNGPVCSPTRAALMTGRYQQRCGVEGVLTAANHRDAGLAPGQMTLAEVLKQAGYATAIFGKWHLGYQEQFNPVQQGFDEFRGFLSGNVDYHSHVDQEGHADWWNGAQPAPESGYVTDNITHHAVRFIEANKAGPFFLYVPHLAVHYPYQTRMDAAGRQPGTKPADVPGARADKEGAYHEMLKALDEGVGRIIDTLRQHGLTERTLVFFTSDNGPSGPGKAGALSGKKGTLMEGGHRVPAIAWWPGSITPGETSELGLTMDLFPTFAALAGAPLPNGLAMDGVDLSGHLLRRDALGQRTVFWRFKQLQAVRSGPWKLQVPAQGRARLFNLEHDLAETRDLAASHPEKVAELESALSRWTASLPKEQPVAR